MTDLEIIKLYYGFTTKEAKAYKKATNKNTIEKMKIWIEDNAKKVFYED